MPVRKAELSMRMRAFGVSVLFAFTTAVMPYMAFAQSAPAGGTPGASGTGQLATTSSTQQSNHTGAHTGVLFPSIQAPTKEL